MGKGVVLKSTGSWYQVLLSSGAIVSARTRGKLRTLGSKNTNPVAVGDRVKILQDGEDHLITEVDPRTNYIIRKATNLSKQTHIIAANLDQAFIVTALKEPKLKLGFIDRFLVTAEAYGIKAWIVFNKTDLLTEREQEYLDELCDAYKKVGYDSLQLSVKNGNGIEQIREKIDQKTTLVAGHSGVGKSSLLNLLLPKAEAKVSEVSESNEKGQHTTTFAEMYIADQNTFIIDTPGLKSFGLIDMEQEELKNYFPEMHDLSHQCKYHNCLHLNEPGCAVKPAFDNGQLPWFRYENYMHIYNELKALK